MLGQSFAPMSEEDRLRRSGGPQGAPNAVQEAIKVLSLRVPRVLGANAPVSRELLTGLGGAGIPQPQPMPAPGPTAGAPSPSPMATNPFTPPQAPQFENPLQAFLTQILTSGAAPSPEAGQITPPPPRVGIVTPGVEDPNPPPPTTIPTPRERIISKRENPWTGRQNNTSAF